jgi:acetyl esterase/lipase
MSEGVAIHLGIAYANHDGVELLGDLYLPKTTLYLQKPAKAAPALVAVHGGGWVAGVRGAFQYWGPYLAARGIAVFAISYRLATKSKTFPEAVQDVIGAQRREIFRRLSAGFICCDRHTRQSIGRRLWRL